MAFASLFKTHQQLAKSFEPRVRSLHHPPTSLVARILALRIHFFSPLSDVRPIWTLLHRLPDGCSLISCVSPEMLGCEYSGQILSYQRVLGQLQDAGNTTTLAHYLDLLAGDFGIQRSSGTPLKLGFAPARTRIVFAMIFGVLQNVAGMALFARPIPRLPDHPATRRLGPSLVFRPSTRLKLRNPLRG